MTDWIYFDNHTRTRPSKALIEEMKGFLEKQWLIGPIEIAKRAIGEYFNAPHVLLTQGGGEGNFHVLLSHYIDSIRETGRTHLLTLESEQSSIVEGVKRLEKFEVQGKMLPVNTQGQLTKEGLQEALRARSSLLSISWAHPLTGVIQPIHDLYPVCKENDIRLHLDVSAAIGKLSLLGIEADYITVDGQLFHCPGEWGAIISKEKVAPLQFGKRVSLYAGYALLAKGLEIAEDELDHFAMEVGRLRDLLEKKLEALGAQVFFKEVERLSNSTVFAFEGIHGELLLAVLKKEGIFVTTGEGELARTLIASQISPSLAYSAISIALSKETTEEEINRFVEVLEKIRAKKETVTMTSHDAVTKNMRLCLGNAGSEEEGKKLSLFLLLDEEYGVVADARFQVFGPPSLVEATKVVEGLLLRKNYLQAKRLSADLIEKKMKLPAPTSLNLILEAIDQATEKCFDIPIEDVYVTPAEMGGGERQEYPGWENLTNGQKKEVISQVVANEIQPYVELDAGGVTVLKVEENRVTIAYSGSCTTCYSATGSTLDAIGNILRHKIYPDLMVIPDLKGVSDP